MPGYPLGEWCSELCLPEHAIWYMSGDVYQTLVAGVKEKVKLLEARYSKLLSSYKVGVGGGGGGGARAASVRRRCWLCSSRFVWWRGACKPC